MTVDTKKPAGRPPRAVAVKLMTKKQRARPGNPSLGIVKHCNFAMTAIDQRNIEKLQKEDHRQFPRERPLKLTEVIRAALRMAANGQQNTREEG